MPTELIEHLSGAGIIVSDLTDEESRAMMGISDYKILAETIRKYLEDIEPGHGKIFGAFHSETEAAKFQRQVAARARDLKWYEAYGMRTPKGQWKAPYKAQRTQVKHLDIEKHLEFAEVDEEMWVVKVQRFPLDHPKVEET